MKQSQKTPEPQSSATKNINFVFSRTLVRRLEKLADSKKISFDELVLFILSEGVNTPKRLFI